MEPNKTVELKEEEKRELNDGQTLYELTKHPGFDVIRRYFEELAFHSWIDPRETQNKEDYLWRELNGFHAANNAREFLEWLKEKINRADYLDKKRLGELKVVPMKI
jgi:hypothetical protein